MKSLEIIKDYIERLFIFESGTILIEKDELETIKQDLEKSEKLEKAFEIFKRLINNRFAYVDLEYGIFDGTIDITEEEVELLEELMKSE